MSSLSEIRQLIEAGQRADALPLAVAYVKAHPDDVTGWVVLAQALDDPDRQRETLQRALRIAPTHPGARGMLDALGGTLPPLPGAPPESAAPHAATFTESPFTASGSLAHELEHEPEAAQDEAGQPADAQDAADDDVPDWMQPEEAPAAPADPAQPALRNDQFSVDELFSWEEDILGIIPPDEQQPEDLPDPDLPMPLPPGMQGFTPFDPSDDLSDDDEIAELERVPDEPPWAAFEPEAPVSEPPAPPDPQPEEASPPAQQQSRGGFGCLGWALVGLLLLVIAAGVLIGLNTTGVLQLGPEPTFTSLVIHTPARTLPPTWTPSPVPSATPSPVPTDLPTATATPQPLLLPEVRDEMLAIQHEVAELRGLDIREEVHSELIPLLKLRMLVMELLIDEGDLDDLEQDRIVYGALGFLDPNYDLTKAAVDHAADALGGFYVPDDNNLYVVGTTFGGIERYVYSHEYMHALQDQHYDLASLGVYPECLRPQQECQAIQALVEGEASVVMDVWLHDYATAEDFQFISVYVPPTSLFSDDEPAPVYYGYNSQFAYGYGQLFVLRLLEAANGQWSLVDQAYRTKLPQTTEQILHPEKYFNGEVGMPINDPGLENALGADYQLLERDALGEWQTYLLLSAANAPASRVPEFIAAAAAAGWGGDNYQVYYNAQDGLTAMSIHWVWETQQDASEFYNAFSDSLAGRYTHAEFDGPGTGNCWLAGEEYSCIYRNGTDVLWLFAQDYGDLELIKALFSGF